ncbi:hypothetical protein MHYP_G00201450 [Metynnis hypsauchen]
MAFRGDGGETEVKLCSRGECCGAWLFPDLSTLQLKQVSWVLNQPPHPHAPIGLKSISSTKMEMRPHDDVWRTGKRFFKHRAIHTSKACVNGLPRIVPLSSAVQVCSFGLGKVGRRKPQPTQRRAPQDNISSVGSLSTGTGLS